MERASLPLTALNDAGQLDDDLFPRHWRRAGLVRPHCCSRSITTGNVLALLLYFIAPLPVLLAALGWNHRAGIVAAIAGALAVAVVFGPLAGVVFATSVALPAWWYAYLLLLARTTDDGVVEWYPLGKAPALDGRHLGRLTMLGALMLGSSYKAFVRSFERAVSIIEQINPNTFQGVSPEAKDAVDRRMAQLFAVVAPPISAAVERAASPSCSPTSPAASCSPPAVCRARGRTARCVLPGVALGALLATAAASAVLRGFPGLFALSFAAALAMAFCLQGLAVIHVLTRGVSGRGGILAEPLRRLRAASSAGQRSSAPAASPTPPRAARAPSPRRPPAPPLT